MERQASRETSRWRDGLVRESGCRDRLVERQTGGRSRLVEGQAGGQASRDILVEGKAGEGIDWWKDRLVKGQAGEGTGW
jgi:hypothetical protein